MKSFLVWLVMIWGLAAGAASAEQPVVIELFTSQGCSSCPPADKLLAQVAAREDVIALALHVDYWDYIGWKDKFANAAHTARQRAYARVSGNRMIYTPQMVIGGTRSIVGSKPVELSEALRAAAAEPRPAEVALSRRGDRVTVVVSGRGSVPAGALVQLVAFTPKETVDIRRGENAGRTLEYHNIVRSLVEVGTWDGKGEYRATVRVPEGLGVAVLVQAPGPGRILGAARLR